ncbi:hypothetical protein GDO86_007422 [Hymenochirus boettgeri]|nr:hypothetical protein GDO86_007422 [Hymenochirus boettgeri]
MLHWNALSEVAETYYSAIKKIGEQALQNATCQGLGQLLIQMADSCRSASAGLNVVFQTLHSEIVQQMDKNTKLDMQFIKDSQNRYEMEYRHRAASLDKCMSEAWRMERQRDRNLREMKENVNILHSDMLSFVKESQRAAELEEKRRYRFLAEKHWVLCSSILQYHSRAQGLLQARAPSWKEQIEASRAQTTSASSRRSSTSAQMPSRAAEREQSDIRGSVRSNSSQRDLQRTSSSGSAGSSQQLTRSSSFGEVAVAAVAAAAASASNRQVQAIVEHNTGGNRTLLQFSKGDIITVLVPEARNGWLYGKLEGVSTTGWFPEAYVKSLERDQTSRNFPLRSAHSTGDLLDGSDNFPEPDYRTSTQEKDSKSRQGNDANMVAPPPSVNSNTTKKTTGGPRGELFPR